MKKFNIELDEKCTIWRRCSLKIEANSIEEAKIKAIKDIDLDRPVEYLIDTAETMSRKENAAIEIVDYLMPEDEWEITHGLDQKNIEVLEILDVSSYEIKEKTGTVTKDDLPALKEIYAVNKDNPSKIVIYKEQEILISYMRYLIEYLEQMK